MSIVNKIVILNFSLWILFDSINVFTGLSLENIFALWPMQSENFRLFQLITHLFVHGSFIHIFFNMIFLLLSGRVVEKHLANNFLKFYLLSGLLSSGLYTLFSGFAIIGASGAVFSVITFYLLIKYKDINLFQKKDLLGVLNNVIFIYFSYLIFNELFWLTRLNFDGVAHFAHILGILFAVIYWKFRSGVSLFK